MAWKHVAIAIPMPALVCLSLAAALHLAPTSHLASAPPTPAVQAAPMPTTVQAPLATLATRPPRPGTPTCAASPAPTSAPPALTPELPPPSPESATLTLAAPLTPWTAAAEPTATPPAIEVVYLPLAAPSGLPNEGEAVPGERPDPGQEEVPSKGSEPAGEAAAPLPAAAMLSAPDPAYAFVAAFRDRCPILLDQVPELAQQHSLSCEAAATRMVLAALSITASEDEILSRMGRNADPHAGFRGNVDGYAHHEDLRDYGAYAEVVARVLASYGAQAEVRYGVTDEELRQALREGRAAVVWMTGQRQPRVIEQDGYRLVEGEHVLVVIGLAAGGPFLVHDPWGARPDSSRPGTFFTASVPGWDLFRRMAVFVPLTES